MPTADEAITTLYQQAAQVVGGTAGPSSAQHVENAYKTLTTFAQYGDQVSLGLFPLALALLIFHENFQAGTGDGRFRVAYVLGRAAAIAALIHPWTYGRLCGLITYAAGGHGGWLSGDALLDSVTKSVDGVRGAWTDFAGDDPGISDSFSALINILPLVGIWLVLVCSLLFAYIAGVLLSLSQAVILSILLAVGKTCITVTLVPGVGLGSSWARSLAKVAAWSTVAGIITALMVHAMPDLREMVRNLAYTAMLRTAGQFVVLAICTFSIPAITERIFSGAAPAGNAALEAVSKGWQGAKGMGRLVSASPGAAARGSEGPGAPPSQPGRQGGDYARRPHKVSPGRLREGLAAAGQLALAPLAYAVARVGGRAPGADPELRSRFGGLRLGRRSQPPGTVLQPAAGLAHGALAAPAPRATAGATSAPAQEPTPKASASHGARESNQSPFAARSPAPRPSAPAPNQPATAGPRAMDPEVA